MTTSNSSLRSLPGVDLYYVEDVMRAHAIVVTMVLVLVAGTTLRAHHSYAEFDVDRTVTIQGTIEDILFANPHVVLKVRTKDSGLYTATWSAARQLTRQGVTATQLRKGDTITIVGNPSTRGPEVSKIREVSRPSDGWAWRNTAGQTGITASR